MHTLCKQKSPYLQSQNYNAKPTACPISILIETAKKFLTSLLLKKIDFVVSEREIIFTRCFLFQLSEFQSEKQMTSHIIVLIESKIKVYGQLKVYSVKNTILNMHCAKVWHLKKEEYICPICKLCSAFIL